MEQAIADYQKAVELDPANVQARLNLGELLVNFNRSTEAIEHFKWLRERQPDNVGAGYGLARCRLALGEFDEAALILDELLERYDTNLQLLELRGSVAFQQNKTAEAIGFLRDVVDRAPYLRQANVDLAKCLHSEGRTDEARKYEEQVNRIDADSKRLGELYKLLSKPTHTAAQCQEAATLSLRMGREEDAMRWLEAALLKDPAMPEAHALMADVYERHGDRLRAESHRKQAQRK
jgi:predicted Zn-dependent protease